MNTHQTSFANCPIISSHPSDQKNTYLCPAPIQVLGPLQSQTSDSPSINKAKNYLRSLQPCPTLHPFHSSNESIDRLLDMGYFCFDRLTMGTQSMPSSPRRGDEAIPTRFPHLLSTINVLEDISSYRKIPSAKDRLGVFIPSFSFPLMDEKRLDFNPYEWPKECPSNEEIISRQFMKTLTTFHDLPSPHGNDGEKCARPLFLGSSVPHGHDQPAKSLIFCPPPTTTIRPPSAAPASSENGSFSVSQNIEKKMLILKVGLTIPNLLRNQKRR